MPSRMFIGLAVGSGFDAADAAAVRIEGTGFGIHPHVEATVRNTLQPEVRDSGRHLLRQADPWPTEFARQLGDTLSQAARQVSHRAGVDLRGNQAIGLWTRLPDVNPDPERAGGAIAEQIAEHTGLTILSGFGARDIAAGGLSQLITAAGDALLFRNPSEDRILIHLGAVTSVLGVPANGRWPEVIGFEAGPGNRFLDDLIALGTRSRETCDPGGTRAVQGRCLDVILDRWMAHPFLLKKPPKALPRSAFGTSFLIDAFEIARTNHGTLNDLLCTATHFVANCLVIGIERWLGKVSDRTRILVSGGGSRNGFLWKLLEQRYAGLPIERTEAVGVPAAARIAASTAILAALTLDGVSANLPLVTGAAGGRLIGRLTPGDQRNWAACTAWMANQLAEYLNMPQAA